MLLLLGCETNEVRAWKLRRAELERRDAELGQLEQQQSKPAVDEFRRAIAVPGFLRERGIDARVFIEPGHVRITASGTVQHCRDTVAALAELRWLTQEWRLRLDRDHCDWETRTGEGYATLEQALLAPPPKWLAPPAQLLSASLAETKTQVESLEQRLRARETKLGELVLLQEKLEALKPLVDSLRARPPPCDVAVLDRELALDPQQQGALLEVERVRLVHPLDPRGDFRLRGLAQLHDGLVTWQCEPL